MAEQSTFLLECCVDSIESAILAAKAGADRLEVCSNLMIGGTTPSLAGFRLIRRQVPTKLHVLIRPRFGDFCYTEREFAAIREDLKIFREEGADGAVFGVLRPDGSLDKEAMALLMEEAGGMSVTLHRAFDVSSDPFQTLEDAVSLQIDTILTSGCEESALKGADCLKRLQTQSNGRISIMAGAGIDARAIQSLYPDTGIHCYHMSGKRILNSAMEYRSDKVHMGLPSFSEYEIWQTDPLKVREASMVLKKLAEKEVSRNRV